MKREINDGTSQLINMIKSKMIWLNIYSFITKDQELRQWSGVNRMSIGEYVSMKKFKGSNEVM